MSLLLLNDLRKCMIKDLVFLSCSYGELSIAIDRFIFRSINMISNKVYMLRLCDIGIKKLN